MVRDVVEPLIALIEPLGQPRTWPEQVDQLRDLADGLGLGSPGDPALDHLFDALDDHGTVLERLGRGDRPGPWKAFTSEVEAMVGDLTMPAPDVPPGTIRMAEVDDMAGARADHLILANLAEGTFPTREAIDPRLALAPEEGEPGRPDAAFAREIRRFLRVVGSADLGLVLAYPTGDEQGQELLRAGFLDDLLGRLSDEAERACHSAHRRFDPALVDHPDLAGSPADARVRAVALACGRGDPSALIGLSRLPDHRRALEGVAAALRVSNERTQARSFGRYDGRLGDEGAIRKIADDFGPGRTFSPSQLESFLFCPFQFFLRYVLKLEPIDERDEIDEDYTGRGSRVHRILEELEQLHTQDHANRLDLARMLIESPMRSELSGGSDVDLGLDQIDQRRLVRTIRKYARQHEAYEASAKGTPPEPHKFEVAFGDERVPESYPGLVLGVGDESVRLMGKIDRIDLLPGPTGPAFRVIDYKTGSCPTRKDVKEALYLQLPLYALAVERIVLETEAAVLHDVGYWALAGKGFTSIALKAWEDDREALEEFVVRVVGQLRQGVFPVDSRKGDCNHRCEHSAVCRFAEVRTSGKARDDTPRLEIKA
jgi:CRISPR/Cas system-associated exonuclease Cas4 (RecB family)